MITLPFNLGGIIRDSIDIYRRQNNIPEPDEIKALSVYRRRDTFLEEEFELVREITIDKESLEYIDLFPNITSLTINGIAELNGAQFKHILDMYPNLENLIIKGQEQLQFIDVSKMKKLKYLELISNRSLHRVVGLDEIDSLEQLTFYDNSTYLKEEELCEIVSMLSQNGTHCNFDVLYMPTMNQIGTYNPVNFKWCESVGLGIHGDELKYETNELKEALKKAQEVVSNYIKPIDTTMQKYAILYQWMCENIRYDHESLDNNHVHIEQGKIVGKLGETNGTVNGLVYGSCVCEGYSKSMQLLLKLCGIPSFDISCVAEEPKNITPTINIDGKKRMHIGDHSILKVNIDGQCYYSDITWDAKRFQEDSERQYFLLSKEDISLNHKLIGEEHVFAAFKSVSKQEFQELIKFAQERIKSVDKELEEKSEKTPQERLFSINNQLEQLRQQYGIIGKQMEDLMIRNQQSTICNYHEQLEELINQRDAISSDMELLNNLKNTYELAIKNEQEIEHKNIIAQVERLLGMSITAYAGFAYGDELEVPRLILKDTLALRKEQGAINTQLESLYYDGDLDFKTYNKMKIAVLKEYDSMVSQAPKPMQTSTSIDNSEPVEKKVR